MIDGVVQWTTSNLPAAKDEAAISNWAKMISPFWQAELQPESTIYFEMRIASYNTLSLIVSKKPWRTCKSSQPYCVNKHQHSPSTMSIQDARTAAGTYSSALPMSDTAQAVEKESLEEWSSGSGFLNTNLLPKLVPGKSSSSMKAYSTSSLQSRPSSS